MRERKKRKKKIKGRRGGAEVEKLEDYDENALPSIMTQNADTWWGVFKLLKGDRRLDFLNATLETETKEEFCEGVRLFDAVEDVFNELATKGNLKEGIRLLERFREQKPELYKETYPYGDYKLVYYYASCSDHGKIKEATRYFSEDPERNVDYLFKVLDALRPEQQGMYHLQVIIHLFGFCSYALFALTSPSFTRFLNSKFYIGVGGIPPTWQSKDTSEAIVYTWKSINP